MTIIQQNCTVHYMYSLLPLCRWFTVSAQRYVSEIHPITLPGFKTGWRTFVVTKRASPI